MSLRHDRRRRLLAEEAEPAESQIRLAGANEAIPAYTPDAQAARNRAVAALVPLSRLAISLIVTLTLLLVGACLALDVAAGALAPITGEAAVAALRLNAPGSIARWLTSTLLAASALIAIFIYSLRRHRLDDYQGRYRIWLSMATVAVLTSLAEGSGLSALAQVGSSLVCARLHLRADIVWPLAVSSLAGAVALRLLIEVRRSKTAIAGTIGAVLAFIASIAAHQAWPIAFTGDVAPRVTWGCWLTGYVLVMTTLLLYARFIELEITGGATLPRKVRRKKIKPVETPEDRPRRKAPLKLRTDLDPVEATPATEAVPRKPAASSKPEPAAHSTSPLDVQQALNRSDRRKLKQQRRMAS